MVPAVYVFSTGRDGTVHTCFSVERDGCVCYGVEHLLVAVGAGCSATPLRLLVNGTGVEHGGAGGGPGGIW